MPRLTANSTAMAAILSLGLGLPAHAQPVLDAAQARTQHEARVQKMPGLSQLLDAELAAGLNADRLQCLDGAPRPCADDVPLITPAGVAVQLSDAGDIILAPGPTQPYLVAAGQPTPRDGNLKSLAQARLSDVRAAAAKVLPAQAEAAPEPAPEPQPEPKAAAAPAPEAAPEQPAQAAQQAPKDDTEKVLDAFTNPDAQTDAAGLVDLDAPAPQAKAEAAPKAKPAQQPAPEAPASVDDLAAKLAAAAKGEGKPAQKPEQQAEQKPAEPQPAQTANKDSHADAEPRLPLDEAQRLKAVRADNIPMLSARLQEEINAGLTADQLTCSDGSARPCADNVALVSPKGISAEVAEDGSLIVAPISKQQYTVGEGGKLQARGSNTEAAKEAAEATAPDAEALKQAGNAQPQGEVVTENLAEANVRSSSEDFETQLADAIRKAADQSAQPKESSDRGSDLAKLAIAGLGALAVGQMLNGNRQVALNTGDRVIVTREDGSQQVLKDDNTLLRQAGNEVRTENFSDGSSRTVVTRPDGSQVITIRAADLTVLRRVHVAPNGTETVLIDESVDVPPVRISELPPAPRPQSNTAPTSEAALREALAREAAVSRGFTLSQIRSIPEVRNLVAPVDISAITFETGSAAIQPDQAKQLATLGQVLQEKIRANPREMFLIEGHTDAVGSATYNLALSDRRAESVALALSEYFGVPPENLVVQGYGEEYLKIETQAAERQNRRASVRRITDLLASSR